MKENIHKIVMIKEDGPYITTDTWGLVEIEELNKSMEGYIVKPIGRFGKKKIYGIDFNSMKGGEDERRTK